jgi:hypothetical protein
MWKRVVLGLQWGAVRDGLAKRKGKKTNNCNKSTAKMIAYKYIIGQHTVNRVSVQ